MPEETIVETPAPAPGPGEPPPAATIVLTGTVTERETNLANELSEVRGKLVKTEEDKKAREVRVAELEDQLRAARGEGTPTKAKKNFMQAWLDGEESES